MDYVYIYIYLSADGVVEYTNIIEPLRNIVPPFS